MTVCPDASLILKCLSYEPGTDAALEWLTAHVNGEMVVPSFFLAEVASVLRRKVFRQEMTPEDGQEALDALESVDVRLVWDLELIQRAFHLADELGQSTIYDTLYLAVAEREHCDLWTADARFAATASARFPFVRLLGSDQG